MNMAHGDDDDDDDDGGAWWLLAFLFKIGMQIRSLGSAVWDLSLCLLIFSHLSSFFSPPLFLASWVVLVPPVGCATWGGYFVFGAGRDTDLNSKG